MNCLNEKLDKIAHVNNFSLDPKHTICISY